MWPRANLFSGSRRSQIGCEEIAETESRVAKISLRSAFENGSCSYEADDEKKQKIATDTKVFQKRPNDLF